MQRRQSPYLRPGFAAMAHRGGWVTPEDAPRENSRHAFARAVEFGYRYLETDVHATADGEVIAFHDSVLDRVSDGAGLVADHTWADLAGVRIAGLDPIPRLADLLEEFESVAFNIDIKSDDAVAPLVATLRRLHATDRVCVGSFSGTRLHRFRQAAPEVATSTTAGGVAWATHVFGLRRLVIDPGVALQIPVRDGRTPLSLVRKDVVRLAHDTGRVVHVWTVNDEQEMHRLIDLGVDGIVSDDLTTLKRVLTDRGLWEDER